MYYYAQCMLCQFQCQCMFCLYVMSSFMPSACYVIMLYPVLCQVYVMSSEECNIMPCLLKTVLSGKHSRSKHWLSGDICVKFICTFLHRLEIKVFLYGSIRKTFRKCQKNCPKHLDTGQLYWPLCLLMFIFHLKIHRGLAMTVNYFNKLEIFSQI